MHNGSEASARELLDKGTIYHHRLHDLAEKHEAEYLTHPPGRIILALARIENASRQYSHPGNEISHLKKTPLHINQILKCAALLRDMGELPALMGWQYPKQEEGIMSAVQELRNSYGIYSDLQPTENEHLKWIDGVRFLVMAYSNYSKFRFLANGIRNLRLKNAILEENETRLQAAENPFLTPTKLRHMALMQKGWMTKASQPDRPPGPRPDPMTAEDALLHPGFVPLFQWQFDCLKGDSIPPFNRLLLHQIGLAEENTLADLEWVSNILLAIQAIAKTLLEFMPPNGCAHALEGIMQNHPLPSQDDPQAKSPWVDGLYKTILAHLLAQPASEGMVPRIVILPTQQLVQLLGQLEVFQATPHDVLLQKLHEANRQHLPHDLIRKLNSSFFLDLPLLDLSSDLERVQILARENRLWESTSHHSPQSMKAKAAAIAKAALAKLTQYLSGALRLLSPHVAADTAPFPMGDPADIFLWQPEEKTLLNVFFLPGNAFSHPNDFHFDGYKAEMIRKASRHFAINQEHLNSEKGQSHISALLGISRQLLSSDIQLKFLVVTYDFSLDRSVIPIEGGASALVVNLFEVIALLEHREAYAQGTKMWAAFHLHMIRQFEPHRVIPDEFEAVQELAKHPEDPAPTALCDWISSNPFQFFSAAPPTVSSFLLALEQNQFWSLAIALAPKQQIYQSHWGGHRFVLETME